MRSLRLALLPIAFGSLAAGCDGCTKSAATGPASDASALTSSSVSLSAVPPDAAPASAPATGPFNVILLTVDSLRADMPWAGYERPIAPRLTELYKKSIAYTRAYSTSSFTSKSIPGILTGRYPSELTRTGSFFTKYVDPEQFVCKHLGREGIPCFGAHAHMYFSAGQSGFETGFEEWKIVPNITFDYQTDPYVTSQKLTPIAIEMLEKAAAGRAGKPFFAWFHFMDPHDEYKTHDESPHFGKRARDLYDEEVFYTDLWIGKLLDFIEGQPWASRTAIIVSADHGEAFGEHGLTRHAHEVWEELVHVPMFFHVPGLTPRVVDSVARGHVDLMPTIIELLGAKDTPKLPGTSLVGEMRTLNDKPTASLDERDVIVDLPEDDYNERRRALIHGKTKLIAFGEDARFALFDLESDPKEAKDLILTDKELAAEMRQRYRESKKRIVEIPPRGGIPGRDR